MTHAIDGYDVVVIGGGPAGLNGALMLARSRRSVVVIDADDPRNARAAGVHGVLGHDGLAPAELDRGRGEVRRYGGHLLAGEVTTAARERAGFAVMLVDGWAMEALDEVRRHSWNEVRQRGKRGRPAKGESKRLKDSRWALWKNPDALTDDNAPGSPRTA